MPNWCENDLRVSGPPAELARMLAECFTANPEIPDANKILPYPTEFTERDTAIAQLRAEWGSLTEAQRLKRSRQLDPRIDPALMCLDQPPRSLKDGYNSGGYEWCIANWGVKWPPSDGRAVDHGPRSVVCTFDTPWEPPKPLLDALAARYPVLTFTLRYFECGMACQGRLVWKGGELVDEQSGDYRGNRGG